MTRHQEHAGYFLESISDWIYRSLDINPKKIIQPLSAFNLETIHTSDPSTIPTEFVSEAMVFHNLIQRGLPTRMSFQLEKVFNEAFNIFEEYEYLGGLYHRPNINLESMRDHLIRALHVVDPRISSQDLKDDYEYSWEQLDSSYEEDFYFHTLGNLVGPTPWLVQFMETQTELSDIIKQHSRNQRLERNFTEQRCDFSLEFPVSINGKSGVILEVDGPHHREEPQKRLDQARDEAAKNANWADTIRIPV